MTQSSQGVEPPKTLVGLKQAVAGGEPLAIGEAMYLMLAEQTLDYDMKDGKMVPTVVDYKKTDDEKVKEKMTYIYTYGIGMFKKGFLSEEALRDAVLNKIANRVGMDGASFDKWLEIPPVAM